MCASASLIEDADDDDDDDDVRDNFGVELNDEVGVSVDVEDAGMPEIRLRFSPLLTSNLSHPRTITI